MKTASKKKPVSAQPAQSHQLQSAGGDPDEPQEADVAAASTTTGVKGGRETDSSGHDSKVSAIDGKPASPSVDLTDEQNEVVKRFRKMKSQPDCSELNLGSALLDIKRNQRLPVHGGNIDNSEQLLGLDRLEVRRLVDLAEPHRAEHGGSPARSADVRPSGSSASKQPPASPSVAAAEDEMSAAPAPIQAPEKTRVATERSKVTESAAPQAGAPAEVLTQLPVTPAQSVTRDPTLAPVGTLEPPAPVDTDPPVAKPEADGAVCVGQAPVQAMAEGDEVPAPDSAGRPTIPTHRVGGSPAPSNAAGGEDANESASPTHAAAADGGSTAPASISTVEQKSGARKKHRAARQTSTPVNGEHPDCSIQPAIELPPPVAPEPAGADAKATEHPTGVTVAPPAATQNKKRQKVIKQAASKSMADTPLAPTKQAERLHDLEAIVDRGIETVFEVGAALEEIRDHELFSPQFKTFGEYLQQRWGWSRARCYQLIGATKVRDNLSTRVDNITHLSEPHCRKLGKLTGADQVTAWSEATSAAPDGKVTHENLKKAVAKLLPPAQPMPPDEAPATAAPAVEAAEATPDHALPSEPLEEPTTDQPESPPAAPPAALAPDEFDIDIDIDTEWLVVEQALTRLFRRCPKYRWPVLWERLNAYLAKNPEHIPAD